MSPSKKLSSIGNATYPQGTDKKDQNQGNNNNQDKQNSG
jgi:hypothetical protein